jgi:hypothetical protein
LDIKDEMNKKCSFCNETISSSTWRCPYCGSLLKDSDAGLDDNPENSNVDFAGDGDKSEDLKEDAVTVINDNQPEKPDEQFGKIESNIVNTAVRQKEQVPNPLSNGIKVFLTVISTIIPGLGQLAGIIMAIVFMNSGDDPDRKSFGVALLISSLIFFILSCLGCFIALIAASAMQV